MGCESVVGCWGGAAGGRTKKMQGRKGEGRRPGLGFFDAWLGKGGWQLPAEAAAAAWWRRGVGEAGRRIEGRKGG